MADGSVEKHSANLESNDSLFPEVYVFLRCSFMCKVRRQLKGKLSSYMFKFRPNLSDREIHEDQMTLPFSYPLLKTEMRKRD